MKEFDDTPRKKKPLIKLPPSIDYKLIEKTKDLVFYGEQSVLE